MELADDLDIPYEEIRFRCAGINHMAFYLKFEHRQPDGSCNLYPDPGVSRRPGPRLEPRPLRDAPAFGYFVTESSEHFAEYTPYFIKEGRDDLIEKFGIPLDEYPKRCIEQIERWKSQAEDYRSRRQDRGRAVEGICVRRSSTSVWTGEPSVIYGNVRNSGCITSLPTNCAARGAVPRRCLTASSRPSSATCRRS